MRSVPPRGSDCAKTQGLRRQIRIHSLTVRKVAVPASSCLSLKVGWQIQDSSELHGAETQAGTGSTFLTVRLRLCLPNIQRVSLHTVFLAGGVMC